MCDCKPVDRRVRERTRRAGEAERAGRTRSSRCRGAGEQRRLVGVSCPRLLWSLPGLALCGVAQWLVCLRCAGGGGARFLRRRVGAKGRTENNRRAHEGHMRPTQQHDHPPLLSPVHRLRIGGDGRGDASTQRRRSACVQRCGRRGDGVDSADSKGRQLTTANHSSKSPSVAQQITHRCNLCAAHPAGRGAIRTPTRPLARHRRQPQISAVRPKVADDGGR